MIRHDLAYSLSFLGVTVQHPTEVFVFDRPGTVYGLSWEFDVQELVPNTEAHTWWTFVIVRQGNVINNMNLVGQLYTPAFEIMHRGKYFVSSTFVAETTDSRENYHEAGSTNSMRKVYPGDKLYLNRMVLGSTLSDQEEAGVITFFIKN